MEIRLNDDFFLELEEIRETRYRMTKNRQQEEYEHIEYFPKYIFLKKNDDELIVVFRNEINDFLELLSSFVSNFLNSKKTYKVLYKSGKGFKANIKQKDRLKYLCLEIENKKLYLEKYDCKVIYANAKQFLNKCNIFN